MTDRTRFHQGLGRVLAVSLMAVCLLAASPGEANWLGRGIMVGGVGHSLHKNVGSLTEKLEEVLRDSIAGDDGVLKKTEQTIRDFGRNVAMDAFPVLGLGEKARSAKNRVRELFHSARDTVSNAASLAINRSERKWYKSEAKIVDSRPLTVLPKSSFVSRRLVVTKPATATAGWNPDSSGKRVEAKQVSASGEKPGWFRKWVESEQSAQPDCHGVLSEAKAASCERRQWLAKRNLWPVVKSDPWGVGTARVHGEDDNRKPSEESQNEYEKALAATLVSHQLNTSTDGDYMAALTELEARAAESQAQEEAERHRLEEERRAEEIAEARRREEERWAEEIAEARRLEVERQEKAQREAKERREWELGYRMLGEAVSNLIKAMNDVPAGTRGKASGSNCRIISRGFRYDTTHSPPPKIICDP